MLAAGAASGIFPLNFRTKPLVKCPCAFRLCRLAQSVLPGLGTGLPPQHHHLPPPAQQHHPHPLIIIIIIIIIHNNNNNHNNNIILHYTTLSFYSPSHCSGSLAGIMIFGMIYYCSWVYHIQRLPGHMDMSNWCK